MLDLWLINRWFYPFSSGAGERFRRYWSGLLSRRVLMSVATRQQSGLVSYEEVDRVPVWRFPCLMDFEFIKGVYSFFKRRGFPDVVQFFEPSLAFLPFVHLLRKRGVSCVYAHTLLFDDLLMGLRGKLFRSYFRFFLNSMDAVVSSSSVMTRELSGLGVSGGLIRTIVNGVDIRRFRPPSSCAERLALREKFGFREEDMIVLFVGMLIPRKGLDLLLEAWSEISLRFSRAVLVVVGDRLEGQSKHVRYRKRIEELVASSTDPGRIVFVGKVSWVEQYMRIADLFVFPSEREGFGNVVVEAMASGLSVILTPYIGLSPEIGLPGKTYILVPRTREALAYGICLLLESEDRWVFGHDGRMWVSFYLNLEDTLNRYADLYFSLRG